MKHLTKTLLTLAAVLLLCVLSALQIGATEPDGEATFPSSAAIIPKEGLTDSLEAEGTTNYYKLKMTDKGDAVLVFKSLMKTVGGYDSYWKVTLYDASGAPVGDSERMKGFKYITAVTYSSLEAGTYYIGVSENGKAFTTESYEISLIPCYYSTKVAFEHDGVQIFSEKNQIIGEIDGNYFIKIGEGTAYGVFVKNRNGALVPQLISEDKEATLYVSSAAEKSTQVSSGAVSIDYGGTVYHLSSVNVFEKYTKNNSESHAPYFFVDASYTAEGARFMKLITRQLEKQEKGAFVYAVSHFWYLPLIIAAVVGGVIALIKLGGSSDAESEGYGGSTYTGGPGSVTHTYGSDMDTINRINERISSPDYDVAGFPDNKD